MATLMKPPTGTRACPKCGNIADVALNECPRCQVVIDKAQPEPIPHPAAVERGPSGPLDRLHCADTLAVKQQVEKLEAWTGIETANRYAIRDGLGNVILHATEHSGGVGQFLTRNFLKAARPFTMQIESPEGELLFELERPFRFFFSEVRVTRGGRQLGTIVRRFSWFNSKYSVTDGPSGESYEITGPMWKPWTFYIEKNGQCCGQILKKWSGLGKELFTDADSFGVEFPPGIDPEMKGVFLGAVFLIDFAHFEDRD